MGESDWIGVVDSIGNKGSIGDSGGVPFMREVFLCGYVEYV